MKHPYLQKVTLTAMAVVASFALSAQAKRPTLTTATQIHGKQQQSAGRIALSAREAGKGQAQSPMAFVYKIDDGTAEDSIGLTAGGDVIALNSFTVVAGDESITSLDIAWGTPAFPDPSLNGLPFTACVWSDPNGDGDPSDAVLLTTASGVIADAGTNTFHTTTVSATITTTKFFVGFLVSHAAGQFPAAFDETNPVSNRSYIAGGASGDINNLTNNDLPVAPIESFGLVGNWLIRANSGGDTTPTPTMTPTPPPGVLWYNGDFDGVNGLANQENVAGTGQYAHTWDDFFVTDDAGWDVTSVFSNNLSLTNITGATWEIRQGVSTGNGGTVVASGMTATPVITPTGRSGFGFPELTVEVTGLSLHLNGTGDNHYWLNVAPIGDASGQAFDSTTDGANSVGTPPGNNGLAFFDSDFFGFFFVPSDDPALGNGHDFSMGVSGPSTTGITLTATVEQKNGNSRVNLSWSPADGGDVNVLRNGKIKFTTADDGSATNNAKGHTGTVTYQVCETDTGDCSNVASVTIP